MYLLALTEHRGAGRVGYLDGDGGGTDSEFDPNKDDTSTRGTNGPMQRILDMRGRCMQYNKKRTTEGRIDWVDDRVLYKDIGFDVGHARTASMRSHIKAAIQHSTTATRLRQRQQAIEADTRRWRTFCQRFFTNGAKSSCFEVHNVDRETAGRPPTPEPTTTVRQRELGPTPAQTLLAS
ncbi:hypothetical protein V8E54_014591 [Elaphomyces granulatus]